VRVTVSGIILADSFGRVPDSEYVYGDLADIGWKVRFSCTKDKLTQAMIDTLDGGNDLPVTITGNLEAALQRQDAVLKLKALVVAPKVHSNSRQPEPAKS